jgi:hypothetical protein
VAEGGSAGGGGYVAFYGARRCAESAAAFEKAVRLCATCLGPAEKEMLDECRGSGRR